MRVRLWMMAGLLLAGSSPALSVGSAADLPAPTYDIPFDDYDESAAQAELTAQLGRFLNIMQRYHGGQEASVRQAVSGEAGPEEQGKLIVIRNLADHGVLEGYEFRDGVLMRGEYRCLQQPINGLNEFIGYYQAAKITLTQLFGQPIADHTLWDNDLYKPLPDYWGVAVLIGHLRYAAQWETPDGVISLTLTGNRHSRLLIEFQSAEYLSNRHHT